MILRYIFLFLISSGCTSLFYHPTRNVYYDVDATKIKREEIYLQTSDNLKLHGWYFPAQTKSKGLILFFHGNAQNLTSHFVTLFWFTQEDFDYAIFDYRAYGKSEGRVDNDKSLLDIAAMMKWGEERAKSKKIPFIVYGQSLGANLSLKFLSLHSEVKPDLAIFEAPFYKFTEIAKLKAKETWILWPLQPLVSLLISDKNSLDEKELKMIPNYPKIFLHSEKDPIVPFSQGKKTFDFISEPKELWTYTAPHHVNGTHVDEGKYKKLLLQRIETLKR